jgi:hypothetical protein
MGNRSDYGPGNNGHDGSLLGLHAQAPKRTSQKSLRYDRVIRKHGNQRRAEAVLETREKRVENLHIRALTNKDRDQFAQAWQADRSLRG